MTTRERFESPLVSLNHTQVFEKHKSPFRITRERDSMMLKIDLHTPLGPLVLRPSSTSISGAGEERTIPVVGILNIRANKRTHIGGIRLGWKVTLEKRNTVATSAKSKNRDGWGPAEVIKSFELDVEGEMWVEEGQTQWVQHACSLISTCIY